LTNEKKINPLKKRKKKQKAIEREREGKLIVSATEKRNNRHT
jgi:hypothetical protein